MLFYTAMAMLQSASLEPEAGAFIYGVIHHAPELFSSIEHVVKENAQVMFELEKLGKGGKGGNLSMSNPSYLLTRASRD